MLEQNPEYSASENTLKYIDQQHKMLIGNEWRSASDGRTIPVIDPSTGNTIATAPFGSAEDVDDAVRVAQQTFEDSEWSRMRPGSTRKAAMAVD